jgi:hypothetical protein
MTVPLMTEVSSLQATDFNTIIWSTYFRTRKSFFLCLSLKLRQIHSNRYSQSSYRLRTFKTTHRTTESSSDVNLFYKYTVYLSADNERERSLFWGINLKVLSKIITTVKRSFTFPWTPQTHLTFWHRSFTFKF